MDLVAGLADQSVSFAAWTTATGEAVTITAATDGLSLWYQRGGTGAKVAITPHNLATLETAHTDGGILVKGGAEHRLDLPNAACAVGVNSVQWGGEATGITIDGGVANLSDLDSLLAAVKTKTDLIVAGGVMVRSPVLDDGTLLVVQGNAYPDARGLAIQWTDDGGSWPDLTDAAVTLIIRAKATDAEELSIAGTIVDAATETQGVRFEPDSADTAGLSAFYEELHTHRFGLRAVWDGDEENAVVFLEGDCTVRMPAARAE